jgi:hypothetical protein
MYGLSTLVSSTRSVCPASARHRFPYVGIVTSTPPSGTPIVALSSV